MSKQKKIDIFNEFLEPLNFETDLFFFSSHEEKEEKIDEFIPVPMTEIEIEKRKRHQAYLALNQILENYTYFDFFSKDLFKIAKLSKFTAQYHNKNIVTPEIFFLNLCSFNSEIENLLTNNSLKKSFIKKLIQNLEHNEIKTKNKETFLFSQLKKFKKVFDKKRNQFEIMLQDSLNFSISSSFPFFLKQETKRVGFPLNQKIQFSFEMHQIFEKSSENALTRFKTPIITPEVLLLTIMEDKNLQISQIIKNNLLNETEWYLLRYKLLKDLHKQELVIRSNVSKNQYFFAYLLKTELSAKEFETLIERDLLEKAVGMFRNVLFTKILEIDIFDLIENETFASMNSNLKNQRKFSELADPSEQVEEIEEIEELTEEETEQVEETEQET